MKTNNEVFKIYDSPFAGKLIVTSPSSVLLCLSEKYWILPTIYIEDRKYYSDIYNFTRGIVSPLKADHFPVLYYNPNSGNRFIHLNFNSRFEINKKIDVEDKWCSTYKWFDFRKLRELNSSEKCEVWFPHLSLLLDIFEFEDRGEDSAKKEKN